MGTSKIAALALGLGLAGCASGHPQGPTSVAMLDCANLTSPAADLYGPGKVKHVEPTYRQEFLARAIQPRRLVGANLYVPAEPGMTPAYAERVLACHASASGPAQANDPLRVDGAKVRVSMAGPSMRIAITGKTHDAGREIWQRAQTLVRDQVTVEQLSGSLSRPTF
jgi:hypothetical protein